MELSTEQGHGKRSLINLQISKCLYSIYFPFPLLQLLGVIIPKISSFCSFLKSVIILYEFSEPYLPFCYLNTFLPNPSFPILPTLLTYVLCYVSLMTEKYPSVQSEVLEMLEFLQKSLKDQIQTSVSWQVVVCFCARSSFFYLFAFMCVYLAVELRTGLVWASIDIAGKSSELSMSYNLATLHRIFLVEIFQYFHDHLK